MSKTIHFLAGLPRTGSTLLGSIMSQHPDVHVTPTSPLYSLLVNANEHFNLLRLQYTFDEEISGRVYRSIVEAVHGHHAKPTIFDKHRGWPKNVDGIREFVNSQPRIIATVRPIAEIIASYIVLADNDPTNFIDTHLARDGIPISNEARANLLWTNYLNTPYECLMAGLRSHPESILLVEYDDIVFRPEETLREVYEFCGIEDYKHDLDNIENRCAEAKDEAWGMKNLHTIRPTLERQSVSPYELLPTAAVDYFSQFNVSRLGAFV